MLKYFILIVCYSLFFLIPLQDMKEENKVLNEHIYHLEMVLDDKENNIDSLSILVNNLNKKIDLLKVKPIIKKRIVSKDDTLVNKININDTVK